MSAVEFRIVAWAGSRHPNGVPYGAELFRLWFTSEHSASMDLEICQERMAKGEISRISFADCRPGGTLTNSNVQPHTEIEWSWMPARREYLKKHPEQGAPSS